MRGQACDLCDNQLPITLLNRNIKPSIYYRVKTRDDIQRL